MRILFLLSILLLTTIIHGQDNLEYDWADDFSEGLAKIRKGAQYGFIDSTGKIIIPTIYDHISEFK